MLYSRKCISQLIFLVLETKKDWTRLIVGWDTLSYKLDWEVKKHPKRMQWQIISILLIRKLHGNIYEERAQLNGDCGDGYYSSI